MTIRAVEPHHRPIDVSEGVCAVFRGSCYGGTAAQKWQQRKRWIPHAKCDWRWGRLAQRVCLVIVHSGMAEYRCHYLEDGQACSQVVVHAIGDATALAEAEELLASSRFSVMEVWQGSRLVGRVTLGIPAELAESERSGQTPERHQR
jgi:hypothetical protein